jgi:hypothetical protein
MCPRKCSLSYVIKKNSACRVSIFVKITNVRTALCADLFNQISPRSDIKRGEYGYACIYGPKESKAFSVTVFKKAYSERNFCAYLFNGISFKSEENIEKKGKFSINPLSDLTGLTYRFS